MEVSVLYDFAFILFCFTNAGLISHVARYGWWSLHPLRFASPPLSGEGNHLHLAFLKQNRIKSNIKLFLNTYL